LARFITEIKRTNTCCELTKADIGKEVVLFGWVNNRRDHSSRSDRSYRSNADSANGSHPGIGRSGRKSSSFRRSCTTPYIVSSRWKSPASARVV
jgi:hypothetical protein